MAEGEIKIIITGNVGEETLGSMPKGGAGNVPTPNTPAAVTQSSSAGRNLLQQGAFFAFANVVKGTVDKSARYVIGNIGNVTGDYIAQTKVNQTLGGISFLAGGVTSFVAGGPVGLAIWATTTVVSEVFEQIDFQMMLEKGRITTQYYRSKVGDVLRDNSRGGM
jgi:hypothetical protein